MILQDLKVFDFFIVNYKKYLELKQKTKRLPREVNLIKNHYVKTQHVRYEHHEGLKNDFSLNSTTIIS